VPEGRESGSAWANRSKRRPAVQRARLGVEPVAVVKAGFHGSADFYVRLGVLGILALTAFGVLALRLWSLQVIQGPRLAGLATRQAVRTIELPAPRGGIFDARYRPLAGTAGTVALAAETTLLGSLDGHGRWRPDDAGRLRLRQVARLTHIPAATLIRRITRAEFRSPYSPAIIVPRIPRELADFVDERQAAFSGIHVVALPGRDYPQGSFGSEFLGLLGEISPAQLRQRSHRWDRPGQLIGQSGAEATYDSVLNGGLARARVVVDAQGRPLGPGHLVRVPPSPRQLQLTIDARLQRMAERGIRDGIRFAHEAGHPDAHAGAAVVINPRDGSLYALASYPHFDQVRAAADPGYLQRLLGSNGALLNRATQGLYPAGSTFKPIVAEAALAGRLITPSSILPCTGSLQVGNVVFHNVEAGINASLNLPQALSISCDTWFYRLGEQFYWRQRDGDLGIQRWARRLGLGHPTGLDLPGESAGIVPTPAWLRRTFRRPWERIWYEGYSVNLSIGQGYLAITPLQLAVAYSALANGGTVVRPHVGKAILDPDGRPIRRLRFRPARHLRLVGSSAIRDGLVAAAHSAGGTSSAIFGDFPIRIAGKTGTAQVPSGSDDSWYASWAPAYNPKVVVVVLIEHGGFGAEAAAPAAKEIYSSFFGLHHARRRAG
jgi:penicillin-binding protein 2